LHGKVLNPPNIAGAAGKVAEAADPDDDIYASAEYKRHMATVLARRAIEAAVQRGAS
jgi:carbon-monoxide dehydrogenase medium subunit